MPQGCSHATWLSDDKLTSATSLYSSKMEDRPTCALFVSDGICVKASLHMFLRGIIRIPTAQHRTEAPRLPSATGMGISGRLIRAPTSSLDIAASVWGPQIGFILQLFADFEAA
jgi:hypothetical protein